MLRYTGIQHSLFVQSNMYISDCGRVLYCTVGRYVRVLNSYSLTYPVQYTSADHWIDIGDSTLL